MKGEESKKDESEDIIFEGLPERVESINHFINECLERFYLGREEKQTDVSLSNAGINLKYVGNDHGNDPQKSQIKKPDNSMGKNHDSQLKS